MKLEILLISFLCCPVTLLAQTEMSLDECIRLAWKQNPVLKNSGIDTKEAKLDYITSIGNFLPRVAVKSEVGKSFGRSVDPVTNIYTTDTFEQGTIGFDMTLSLFEGFSRINQVRFNKMNRERSEWEWKEKQNVLAYQVTDAYYKLILEQKLLILANEQCKLSERYLKQTETFVELGLKSTSDLQEVKARKEGDVFRRQSRENSCQMAVSYLKQLMNICSDENLAVQDTITETEIPIISVPRIEHLYANSIEVMPFIHALEWKQRATRKAYAVAGGAFSPSVYAVFSMGSHCNNTFFSSGQFGANVGKYVGVGISFPLLNGLERLTNLRKHKLEIYRMNNESEQVKQQLYTDVEQTILSLQSGYKEHQQALLQLGAEQIVLKESERKWEEGLISVFQLMEAKNRFVSAKAELTRIRLQVEMLIKMEQYYREGRFL